MDQEQTVLTTKNSALPNFSEKDSQAVLVCMFSVWFLTLAACILFFVYSTMHHIYSAWLLYHHEPPSQMDYLKQTITEDHAELQRKVNELEELFNQKETFTVTAYTHTAKPGVPDINGTGTGITASGIPVQEGLVAVDLRLIPLGSQVLVEGLGVLLAADTGGAINGNRLDVFFDCRTKALNFGRQKRWAVILPSPPAKGVYNGNLSNQYPRHITWIK